MTLQKLQEDIQNCQSVSLYISATGCGVCEVLQPKVQKTLQEQFPNIQQYFISSAEHKDISAHFGVLSAPTLLVFFQGKEFLRKSRNISMQELVHQIQRPYQILFGA